MSFRPKPWYFERDCPVCTRSASSFCHDPLSFFARAMRVKWWYHAKFQPFRSSFVEVFQFQGHLAQNRSVNAWKIANYVRKGCKLMTWLCMLHVGCKKVRSCNKLLKFWIAGVTDEFSSETLILRKRLSSLHTKCIQFLHWLSLLFCTCYAGEMMIPSQVSTFSMFICSAFQFQGHLAQNKSVNASKTTNDVRTSWKLMTSLWMLHTEHKRSPKFK